MFSKPLAFGLLALACIAAAAGGGYFATRYNVTGTPAAAASAAGTAPQAASPGSPAATAPRQDGAAVIPSSVADRDAGAAAQPDATPTATTPADSPAPTPRSNREAKSRRAPAAAPNTADAVPDRAQPESALPPPPAGQPAQSAGPPVPTQPPLPVEAQAQQDKQISPPPPDRDFDELVVPADSILGLQLGSTVSSDTARVEDPVEAKVTRDVTVGGRMAIPAGSRVLGSVTLVERGGKVRERGRLGLRFHTLMLPDGTRTAINSDVVYREGQSPARKTAAKIGGAAIGGAIVGAIIGGGRGAAIGSTVGVAGGTAAVAAGGAEIVRLPAGTIVNVRLLSQTTVTVER